MSAEHRKRMMAEIVTVMRAARDAGQDHMEAARRSFPGIPEGIVSQADIDLSMEDWERDQQWLDWAARTMMDGEATEVPERKRLDGADDTADIPY